MNKLLKQYKKQTIVKQTYGGLKVYRCLECRHIFNIAVNSKEVKCFYCGNTVTLIKRGL